MAKKNISLENVINGKIKLFKDQNTDWNMKQQGLEAILKKIDSLPSDIKQKELEQNCKNLDEIVKMCESDNKLKKLAKTLDDLLSAQSTENITTQLNTKGVVKKETLNVKKSDTTKKIITKTQSKVSTSTPKSNNQNDNIMKNMFENIIKQENIQISSKLTSIEAKVKTLGKDLEHNKTLINKSIKDVQENLDPIKAISNKIDKVNDSINNIEIGTVKKSRTDIPKDVQAIEKLTEFMKEGLEQFENIATYYVTKQSEFEKAKEIQKELDFKIEEEKNKSFKEGELKSKIDMAKSIYNKFPNDFNKLKSLFEDILSEKYEANDEITITSENSNELGKEIEGKLEDGKTYQIKKPAVLIGEEVLIRATVEMSK